MTSECEFQANSPLSYSVEEGQISSGATSPATIVESNKMGYTHSPQTNTHSPRPQSPGSPEQEQPKVKSFVVKVDNTKEQEVKYNSQSEKRRKNASRAKQVNQQVQYNPNYQPVANLSYQYNQVHASPL